MYAVICCSIFPSQQTEQGPSNPMFGDLEMDEQLKSMLEGDAALKEEFEKLNQAAARAEGAGKFQLI